MILRVFLTLWFLIANLACIEAGPVSVVKKLFVIDEIKDTQPSIKILLARDLNGAILEVRGGYKIYDAANDKKIGSGIIGKNYFIQPSSSGIKWGESFPGIFQIKLVPNEETCLCLVNGIQYSGNIFVFQIGDRISIVNDVNIEDFVKVVLGQMFAKKQHPEVLAALAITTRTAAYYHALRGDSAFWHLDSGVIDYQGYGVTMRDNGIDSAVNATRALVLQGNDLSLNGFFDATFTSNCAGKTAPYHLIYRKHGNAPLKGVDTPFSGKDRDKCKWEFSCSLEELAAFTGLPKITSCELYSDANSGKVYGVRFYNESNALDMDFFTLQGILGTNHLKSSDFIASLTEGQIKFAGFGEGPGVGLCLYSAQIMAKKGHDAAEILEAFFPDTKLILANSLDLLEH